MTTCCWEEDTSSRPTVDHVLDALRSASEQRESKHEEIADPSPWDDWSPTLMEDSDPAPVPEHENGPAATTSGSSESSQSSVVETPLPAPTIPIRAPPVLVPPTAKDKISPTSTPTTSKEVMKLMPANPPRRGEERKPAPGTSKKDETKEEDLLTPTWKRVEPRPVPPAPRDLGNVPQTTLNAKLNVCGPRPTPDQVVDRLLERAKSPLGEGEVRKVVEVVEKVSWACLLSAYRSIQPVEDRCCSPSSN